MGHPSSTPFSGRGMIPLEAARLGLPSYGIDYSPVAVLASHLLDGLPVSRLESEPELPFGDSNGSGLYDTRPSPLAEMSVVCPRRDRPPLGRYCRRASTQPIEGNQPWGYMWAVTLPCQECGQPFPARRAL